MLGGLARRVAYEEKVRREKQSALIVDSGDLFFDPYSSSEKQLTKAELIGRAYREMGSAAVNVGEVDLLKGVDFLRGESSRGLPLISANLVHPTTKEPLFPPFLIREAGGVRVAFFGLLSPEFPPGREAIKSANEGKILVRDPVESARETVQKLKGKADLIILLSDLGLHKDQILAKAVPGIHFILGGHEGRYTNRPEQAGNTVILQSSLKGMYVGQLRIIFENSTSPFKNGGEDEQILERINALDQQILSLNTAKQRTPHSSESFDRVLRDLEKQKSSLQEQLKKARNTPSQGNQFFFTLQPMETSLPESAAVKKWIAQEGLEED